MKALLVLIRRDLTLAGRIGGGAELGLVFFLTLVAIVPFAIGPDQNLLARLAPAVLWIAALLATLFGLDRLFQADEEEGVLDQFLLSATPLELIVLAKCVAHWLTTGLVLSLAAPLFGLMLNMPVEAMLPLAATLLVGTPAITLIGAVGAAVTVSLRRGGLLMAILVLPLAVPTLIFGVGAANAAIVGPTPFGTPFLLLLATTLAAAVICPVAAAAAIRLVRG
ncbi:MAG: heme exporter protein CcmB [Methylocystis sp.]|nr:heme exporter protein CcmB [Methylocystis sp.]MCA3589812.1 heme exporter protein CcmB [Methylocystis sp.]MCA3591589.1 heme exporter protein CcmB [Methylocystis sp.]